MSALIMIAAVTMLALVLGSRARQGHDMNLEQWAVGGRSFGTVFVFLLMAGEIYTTFTFLGGSGFAYGKGAAAYYILGYGTLAYIMSYWMLPPIWRYAKAQKIVSQPQFFARKYDSPVLGVMVAMVGATALIPYLVLQFKGLGIIVSMASYGVISPTVAVWIGAVVVTVYVAISGVRGSAWNAMVKDVLILIVVLVLGIYLPIHYYGNLGDMFRAIDVAKPGFLTFQSKGTSLLWFQSTTLIAALGFFMWPHTFGSVFTAKDDRIFRRNAIVLPLYQLVLLFVFFVGFAAVLKVPGLSGTSIDLALFRLSQQTFDPWFVGVIGAAGVLTALVPASMIVTTASTLLANDLYRGAINRNASDAKVAKVARLMVPLIVLLAVFFTLKGGTTIVAILLVGYNIVTQLFPAAVCSLMPNSRATRQGAVCGVAAGVAVAAITTLLHLTFTQILPFLPDSFKDLNVGFAALVVNIFVFAVVSAITQPRFSARASI